MYTSSQHLIIWASKVKSVKNKEIKNLDFANSMIHLRNKGKNIYFYHLKIEKKYDANKIYYIQPKLLPVPKPNREVWSIIEQVTGDLCSKLSHK